MTILILDTETTGVGKTDEVIQLAYVPLSLDEFEFLFRTVTDIYAASYERGTNAKYRPSVPIHPEAAKVNGMKFTDLLKCPPSKQLDYSDLASAKYIIGHNIVFDKRMLLQCIPEDKQGILDHVKFICTMGLSKTLDKNLGIGFPNNKLDTLINHFFPEDDFVKTALLTETHDALGDVIKTIIALGKLCEYIPAVTSFQELYSFQEQLKSVKKKK